MNTFSYRIFLRENTTNSKNENPIYVCLTHNRKSTQFSLNVSVLPQNWNCTQNAIKRTDIQHIIKNAVLERAKKRLSEIHYNSTINESIPSFQEIIEIVRNESGKLNFYEFVYQRIGKMNLEPETVRTYKSKLSKLKQFKENVDFKDITPDFIRAYTSFAVNKGNKPVTWNKDLEILNRFCNWAVEDGKIKENPLKNTKIKRDFEGNREFLAENELNKLIQLFETLENKYLKNTLRNFLFSCFTGLRYGDMKRLQWTNIIVKTVKDKEIQFVEYVPKKTAKSSGKIVSVPLKKEAIELLPEKRTVKKEIFKVLANQPTNRYLKEIAELAGITKVLSFHCARHTFATVLLSKNGNINSVRAFLGHKKLSTTQIYAKLLPENMVEEMEKWS